MSDNLTGDAVVYFHSDGATYVAVIEGQWLRWPAVSGGWASRRRVTESAADGAQEIEDGRLARLAFSLSGADR